MSRKEATQATSKPDGPNYKGGSKTARPTVEEVKAGKKGTEAFVVVNDEVRLRSEVEQEDAGPGAGRGIFDGEEKRAHDWRGEGASGPEIVEKKPSL